MEDIAHPLLLVLIFFWLFAVILWSAISVVRHADALAIKFGEPYGTLILTLSAISIEVVMISTAMLHGANNPTLARDAMFAVIMIALGGLVGLSLLLGGLRHREQHYNLQGAGGNRLGPAKLHHLHERTDVFFRAGNFSGGDVGVALRDFHSYPDYAAQPVFHGISGCIGQVGLGPP